MSSVLPALSGLLEPLASLAPFYFLILRVVIGLNFFLGRGVRHMFKERQKTVEMWGKEKVPSVAIYLVGILDSFGALFLIVGLLVPIVSTCFAIFMISTIFVQRKILKTRYFGHGIPSYELNVIYFLLFVLFALIGGGPYSVDHLIGL